MYRTRHMQIYNTKISSVIAVNWLGTCFQNKSCGNPQVKSPRNKAEVQSELLRLFYGHHHLEVFITRWQMEEKSFWVGRVEGWEGREERACTPRTDETIVCRVTIRQPWSMSSCCTTPNPPLLLSHSLASLLAGPHAFPPARSAAEVVQWKRDTWKNCNSLMFLNGQNEARNRLFHQRSNSSLCVPSFLIPKLVFFSSYFHTYENMWTPPGPPRPPPSAPPWPLPQWDSSRVAKTKPKIFKWICSCLETLKIPPPPHNKHFGADVWKHSRNSSLIARILRSQTSLNTHHPLKSSLTAGLDSMFHVALRQRRVTPQNGSRHDRSLSTVRHAFSRGSAARTSPTTAAMI